jgi:hypothetical protein
MRAPKSTPVTRSSLSGYFGKNRYSSNNYCTRAESTEKFHHKKPPNDRRTETKTPYVVNHAREYVLFARRLRRLERLQQRNDVGDRHLAGVDFLEIRVGRVFDVGRERDIVDILITHIVCRVLTVIVIIVVVAIVVVIVVIVVRRRAASCATIGAAAAAPDAAARRRRRAASAASAAGATGAAAAGARPTRTATNRRRRAVSVGGRRAFRASRQQVHELRANK